MLQLLDFLFFVLHCFIISFNLTGWMWQYTRRWHLALVTLTIFSWLVMGMWYGLGYCALTDWHWQVKRALGETNLPHSFLTYLFNDIMGMGLKDSIIGWGAGVALAVVTLLSIIFNVRDYRRSRLLRDLPESNW